MAGIVNRSQSFTCTPIAFIRQRNAFAFAAEAGPYLPTQK